jgi:hypothetical protein
MGRQSSLPTSVFIRRLRPCCTRRLLIEWSLGTPCLHGSLTITSENLEMAEPTLTKEQLAILDGVIAEAHTNRGIVQPIAGSGKAAIWIGKQVARAVFQQVANRIFGGNPAAMKMTAAEREALAKAVEDELTKEPTLEDLVALRKAAKIQD